MGILVVRWVLISTFLRFSLYIQGYYHSRRRRDTLVTVGLSSYQPCWLLLPGMASLASVVPLAVDTTLVGTRLTLPQL